MKKCIIALAVAACISSSLVPGVLATGNSTPEFTVRCDQRSVKPGETVTFTVSLGNAVGIYQIGSIIEYDKDVLTYVSSEACMDYSYSTNQVYIVPSGNTVQASITFSGRYNVTYSDVYHVTFKVNDDADGYYYDSVKLVKTGVTYYDDNKADQGNHYNNAYFYVGDFAGIEIDTDQEEATCGDEITYTVSFPEEFEANGVDINVAYGDNLEFVSADAILEGLQIGKVDNDNDVRMIWLSTDGNKALSGDVAKLTFKAVKRGYARVYFDYDYDYQTVYTVDGKDYEIDFNTYGSEIFISGSTDINIITDKTDVVKGEKIHVSIMAENAVENAVDIEGLRFTLRYDNTLFKLAEEPVNNYVPTKIGTAVCDEEGYIQYIFMSVSPENNINGNVELMSFDLIVTGEEGYPWIEFEDKESLPDGVVDFNDQYVTIHPEEDAAVINAQNLIDSIPEVTADNYNSEEVIAAVNAAQAAYDQLSDENKGRIRTKKLDDAKTLIAEYSEYVAMKDILVTVEKLNGSYIVTANERKPIEAHQKVIAVGYDAEGLVSEIAVTSSENGRTLVSGASVEVFVWDDINSMKPYASVEKVEK